MDIDLGKIADGYNARHRKNRIWKKLVTMLGCLVVFCTIYALILPAITMERDTLCGMREHVHTESCYTRQRGALVCTLAESEGHTHTDACKGTKQVLSCKTPETDGHTHGEGCYDAEGNLTCTQPETQGHHHGDSCYHTEEAFVCGKTECPPHQHTDDCYAWENAATCGIQEHTHTDSCYPAKPEETTTAGETSAQTTEPQETAAPTEEVGQETMETEDGLALFAEDTEERLTDVKITVVSTPKASYDPTKDVFETEIRVDFTIPGSTFNNDNTYIYDYPEGVLIPDNLLGGTGYILEGNRGNYWFEKRADGGYRLRITFNLNEGTQDDVKGYVDFTGELDASKVQDDGKLVVGNGDNQLTIDADEIHYPAGETEKYDITASKSTDGVIKDGKLTYTVTVSSTKGTPTPISLTDTIKSDGLVLGTPTVKVKGQVWQASWDAETGTITMNDLPGLGANESYTIEYTYDVSDYPSAVMNPENKLTVKARDDERHQEVTDEKTVSTKIDKSHTAAKDGKLEGSRIKWTITVNANGTDIVGATLTDDMFGTLSEGTEITVSPSGGYTWENGILKFTGVNGGKNNQTYTITYYTDVPDDETQKDVTNKATFDPGPENPGDEITPEKTVGVGIDADKKGTYSWNEKTITWTITINSKNRDIAGAVLTDDMLSQAIADTIQVSPDNYYELKTDENGQVSITFLAKEDGTNTDTYTIVYKTKADPALAARIVSNTAHLKKDEIEEDVTAEVKIGSDGSVDKSSGELTISEDEATGTLPWTVTIHVPGGGIPAGTELKDTMGDANIYMTNVQVKEAVRRICQALNIGTDDVEVEISDAVHWSGSTFEYSMIDSYTNVQFRKLILKLKRDCLLADGEAQNISVTYDTTVTIDPAKMTETYVNYFKAGEKEGKGEYEDWRSGVVKTDDDGHTGTSTVTSKGALVWKVIITLDDTPRQSLDITDSLPTGVTLDELTLIRPVDQWNDSKVGMTIEEDGNVSGTDGLYTVNGTYNKDTGEVSLKVTAVNGGDLPTKTKLTFVFGCQTDITDDEQHTFTNTVTVAEIGNAFQTQEWTYDDLDEQTEVLDKIGEWHNDSRMLTYEVDINPNSEKLVGDGTGTLTLVDTLSYSKSIYGYLTDENGNWQENRAFTMDVSLVQNSVKLYRVTKNENGDITKTLLSVPWTFEEQQGINEWDMRRSCILHISDVPDGTHLRLEYMYQVKTNVPKNGIIPDLSVKNTVKLEGTDYEANSDEAKKEWKDTDTSGQVTSGKTLMLYKVARGDYGTVLPGAQFTVYTVDTSAYTLTEYTTRPDGSAFPNPITTNESGLLTIRIRDSEDEDAPLNFAYNTLYAIQETKAPAGYRLPETSQVFYFYFTNAEDTEHTLPGNLPGDALDLSQTDQQKFVENEPVPTYELPQTGGSGTRGFTLGGAALTVTGLYLLTRKKRRRRDA